MDNTISTRAVEIVVVCECIDRIVVGFYSFFFSLTTWSIKKLTYSEEEQEKNHNKLLLAVLDDNDEDDQ